MGWLRFAVLGLAVCVGVCYGWEDYMNIRSAEPDSEEHGQSRGPRRTSCNCGWTNKMGGRIVGGRETRVNEYPHMAGLGRYYPGRGVSLFCGSTIVTPYHAITAAHCTYQNYDPMAIIVGDHDLTRADESRYTKIHLVTAIDHPGYDPKKIINDIALLVTSTPIEFNTYVGPACLPTAPMQIEGQWVKVTGWGHKRWKGTVSSTLNKVFLKVISIHSCSRKYYNSIVTSRPNQFCTYNTRKDSCQGDSGGPVTWLDPETNRYTLAGVVSYGGECASEWPGVNTDVYSFLPWINSNIARTSPSRVNTCVKV